MIRLEKVSLSFGRRQEKRFLLRGIDLILPEKGLVAITGKASPALVNIIGAMERASSGNIYFQGEKLSGMKFDGFRARVGYLFQKYFYQNGTVEDNLMQNAIPGTKKAVFIRLLENVNFRGRLRDQVLYLNGGEMVKVNIAQALLKNPLLIIAEEPTMGLNAEEETEIMGILRRLAEEHLLVIATNKESWREYADRVIEIEEGKIVRDSVPILEYAVERERILRKQKDLFSFAKAFNILKANFRKTPFYSFIFILSALIFLAFQFTGDVLRAFDGPGQILDMMEASGMDYGEIYKVKTKYFVETLEMEKVDVEKVMSAHPNFDYYKVLNLKHDYFFPDAKGIVELPDDNKEFDFICGSYPEALNEFIVTEDYAEALLRWTQLLGKPNVEIEDLLGYTLPDYGNLKLVGIIEEGIWNDYIYVRPGYLDSIADELASRKRGYCSYLYVKIGDNREDNYKLFFSYHGDNYYFIDPEKEYIIKNPITMAVFPSAAVYFTMSDLFRSLSKCLFFPPFILAFFLILRALKANRRDFWRKRILGYRNRDFIAAFLIQTFLIFALVLPFAYFFGIRRILAFETIFYQMISSFYRVRFINVLKMIGFGALFMFAAVIFPILKYCGGFPFDFVKRKKRKQSEEDYYLDMRFSD